MKRKANIIVLVSMLLCATGIAQTLRNEVIATGDAWFWDFKKQNKQYKPAMVKGKYYLPYKDNQLIETDGTTDGSVFLSCLNGKGDLLDMAATDNYLYVVMKGQPKNNAYENYYLYRVTPGKDEAVQVSDAYSSSELVFGVSKNSYQSLSLKMQAAGNKLIVYITDGFGTKLFVLHDDERPMAHVLKSGVKNGEVSFNNYFKPLAISGDKIYMYDNDSTITEKSFEVVFSGKTDRYYVTKQSFKLPKNQHELVQVVDVNRQKTFVLLEDKTATVKKRVIYTVDGKKMNWLTDVDVKVEQLISNNEDLYAMSSSSLYKIDIRTGEVKTLLKENRKFGFVDLQQNYFLFRNNRIYYNLLSESYGVALASYKMLDVSSGKIYYLNNTSLGTQYQDEASAKYKLAVLGDYYFKIGTEKAHCSLVGTNIFDASKTLEPPMPVYKGKTLSAEEKEVYGNFFLLGDKLFYWGGSFSYKRKEGKKTVKVKERVMGCISY